MNSVVLIIIILVCTYSAGALLGIWLMRKEEGIGYFVISEDELGNRSVYVQAKESLEEVSKKRTIILSVKRIKLRNTQK